MRFALAPRHFAALSLVLLEASLWAQQPVILRSETRSVSVDVVVTDKKGRYVHDLAAKDFRIWEDNKEQKIESFALESSTPAQQQASYIVVVFDFGAMDAAGQIVARQAAGRFIDANAGSNRTIAVANLYDGLQILQGFTGNAGRLKEAVARASVESQITTSTPGTPVTRGGAPATTSTRDVRTALRALMQLSSELKQAPGRKSIVLFTGNLSIPSDEKAVLASLVEASNQSNVAVYPVDVRDTPVSNMVDLSSDRSETSTLPMRGIGNRGGFGRGGQPDIGDSSATDPNGYSQEFLFAMAQGTGGFVVRDASEINVGLEKIGQEQDEYYLLGYTPPESKEGSCHALKVKLDRGGMTVRARSSYCNQKAPDVIVTSASQRDLEKRAASADAGSIAASLQTPFFYTDSGVARVHAAVEIQPQAIKFQSDKGALHADVNILGVASTADGGTAARFNDSLALNFNESDQSWKSKPIHYEKQFKIAPGQYTFTLVLSAGGESFGKIEQPLTIEPYQAGQLALSGIALSKELRKDGGDASALGGLGLFEDRTPLTVNGIELVPTGAPVFDKTVKSYAYLEAYSKDALTIDVRMFNPKTGDIIWDGGAAKVPALAGKTTMPIALTLPFEMLAPGSYDLDVIATDAAGAKAERKAAFQVK